ncbi:MAG: arginase [Paracoccaceae bacterium]|jgi:arginase
MTRTVRILGCPIETGAGRPGCIMGPAALRTAGLVDALSGLGWRVSDKGDLAPDPGAMAAAPATHANPAVKHLAATIGWTAALADAAYGAAAEDDVALFLGGDHSMALGTVAGVARRAADEGRPLFVLWLDAHPDLHDPHSTDSGNLHGSPVAYFTGQPGFEGFPPLPAPVDPRNICMMGLRSVDGPEKARIKTLGITAHDMRAIDELGVMAPLTAFLDRVRAANGRLHVSLDVDFLEPAIAPAVGTTVPGGATFREAHFIMELLHESGLMGSLDLTELNPFLDERGRTATLMVDLAASLFGRSVLDRPTAAA